ncbi:acyl-CoA thioesterase [Croceicoccus sediminis]|uniref:acyl-CoA thioesterase n=1 Tax=Croceicoccus sediminis TaxID=2571150 RepID=UPI0011844DF1|nr:thioesterase family protein [Croceicoccus sediminis]
MAFETTTQVRFAHVDAAGIVFYPRYFELLNAAVEDWFAQGVGCNFRVMHLDRGIGVPTVHLEVEFLAPSMLGDDLVIRIEPVAVGRSSCTYHATFSGNGEDRIRIVGKLVCMDLAERKSVPWPDDIRERIAPDKVCA